MERSIQVRVVLAGHDPAYRSTLATALRHADCWVYECPSGERLADVLDAHARAGRALDAIVVDGFLESGGVVSLRNMGAFDAGASVIVTLTPHHAEHTRAAYAAGAALVIEQPEDPTELVRAVRDLVHRERRWSGEWISTGKLARPKLHGGDDLDERP